jgi:hypothetical protein
MVFPPICTACVFELNNNVGNVIPEALVVFSKKSLSPLMDIDPAFCTPFTKNDNLVVAAPDDWKRVSDGNNTVDTLPIGEIVFESVEIVQ